MTKLDEIEGIGPSYAQSLKNAGIDTIEELLEIGGDPAGRETIAEKSGLSPKLILEWVNHADLMRMAATRAASIPAGPPPTTTTRFG